MNGHAFFIGKASRIEKLKVLHLLKQEVPFFVEKRITLPKEEYENFINDLGVERQFIDDHKELCRVDQKGVWHSIFIRRRGRTDGVLVMSRGTDRPLYTAYFDSTDLKPGIHRLAARAAEREDREAVNQYR